MTIMEKNAYRAGWMAAVQAAQGVVRYNCDCKHADIVGLVGLLATDDPVYGYKPPVERTEEKGEP